MQKMYSGIALSTKSSKSKQKGLKRWKRTNSRSTIKNDDGKYARNDW